MSATNTPQPPEGNTPFALGPKFEETEEEEDDGASHIAKQQQYQYQQIRTSRSNYNDDARTAARIAQEWILASPPSNFSSAVVDQTGATTTTTTTIREAVPGHPFVLHQQHQQQHQQERMRMVVQEEERFVDEFMVEETPEQLTETTTNPLLRGTSFPRKRFFAAAPISTSVGATPASRAGYAPPVLPPSPPNNNNTNTNNNRQYYPRYQQHSMILDDNDNDDDDDDDDECLIDLSSKGDTDNNTHIRKKINVYGTNNSNDNNSSNNNFIQFPLPMKEESNGTSTSNSNSNENENISYDYQGQISGSCNAVVALPSSRRHPPQQQRQQQQYCWDATRLRNEKGNTNTNDCDNTKDDEDTMVLPPPHEIVVIHHGDDQEENSNTTTTNNNNSVNDELLTGDGDIDVDGRALTQCGDSSEETLDLYCPLPVAEPATLALLNNNNDTNTTPIDRPNVFSPKDREGTSKSWLFSSFRSHGGGGNGGTVSCPRPRPLSRRSRSHGTTTTSPRNSSTTPRVVQRPNPITRRTQSHGTGTATPPTTKLRHTNALGSRVVSRRCSLGGNGRPSPISRRTRSLSSTQTTNTNRSEKYYHSYYVTPQEQAQDRYPTTTQTPIRTPASPSSSSRLPPPTAIPSFVVIPTEGQTAVVNITATTIDDTTNSNTNTATTIESTVTKIKTTDNDNEDHVPDHKSILYRITDHNDDANDDTNTPAGEKGKPKHTKESSKLLGCCRRWCQLIGIVLTTIILIGAIATIITSAVTTNNRDNRVVNKINTTTTTGTSTTSRPDDEEEIIRHEYPPIGTISPTTIDTPSSSLESSSLDSSPSPSTTAISTINSNMHTNRGDTNELVLVPDNDDGDIYSFLDDAIYDGTIIQRPYEETQNPAEPPVQVRPTPSPRTFPPIQHEAYEGKPSTTNGLNTNTNNNTPPAPSGPGRPTSLPRTYPPSNSGSSPSNTTTISHPPSPSPSPSPPSFDHTDESPSSLRRPPSFSTLTSPPTQIIQQELLLPTTFPISVPTNLPFLTSDNVDSGEEGGDEDQGNNTNGDDSSAGMERNDIFDSFTANQTVPWNSYVIGLLSSESPDTFVQLHDPKSPQYMALQWISVDAYYRSGDSTALYTMNSSLQRYALATLYFALGGIGIENSNNREQDIGNRSSVWRDDNAWLSNAGNICDWYGITCDETNTDVTGIDLSSNRLQGTLPMELNLLMHVQNISLPDNNIYGYLPPEYSKLDTLVQFDISNNRLTGSIPWEYGTGLHALQSINLCSNSLQGTIPKELGSLLDLQLLNIGKNNDLSGTVPMEICRNTTVDDPLLSGNNDISTDELSSVSPLVPDIIVDCNGNLQCDCCVRCCNGRNDDDNDGIAVSSAGIQCCSP